MASTDVLNILVPVIVVIAVIAVTALLYFAGAALKDRSAAKREERLASDARAGQRRPRRYDDEIR